jgi:tetratricopeptide (TPR) repeat protein
MKQIVAGLLGAVLAAGLVGCSKEAKKARHLERAESHFKSGALEKAKIEYLNVLRADQTNSRAIRQIGIIFQEQGAPAQAYRFLARSRELSPQDPEVLTKLGLVLLTGGEFAKAREIAAGVLARDPAHEGALMLFADASVTAEHQASARQWLEQARGRAGNKAAFHLASARLFLRGRDLNSAEAAVRQALAVEPNHAQAHMALGDFFRARTNLAEAEREFKTAAEQAPVRSPVRLKYAEFKLATGANAEAKKILTEITDQAPDYLPAWSLLAQIAFAEKKHGECIAFAERVLNVDPLSFQTRQLLAQARLASGQTARAVQELEKLNAVATNSPQARYQLALAYLQQTNASQAAAALEQAIRLNTNFTEAIMLQARLNLNKGDMASVITSMQDLLKRQPDVRAGYLMLVDAYRLARRPNDAATVLRQYAKMFPQDYQPHFFLGMFARESGQDAEARGHFERALALAPDNLPLLYQMVDMDILDKRYPESLARLQGAAQRATNVAGHRFLEARVYRAQGDLNQAEAALKKALEADPNFMSAYQLLATTYLAGNKLSKATEQLEEIVTTRPRDQGSLMLLANIYEQAKDYNKARQTYENLLAINNQHFPALNNLAYLFGEHLGQLDKAHDLARKARSLAPENPAIADTLGWILYKRKDYQGALTLLQEAAEKLSGLPEVQYHLGMASYMMGQAEPARLAFERAMNSPDPFPGKEEAQRHLGLLGGGAAKAGGGSVAELEGILKSNPNDVLARMRLAEAFEKQGKPDQAGKQYEEVLKINPQNAGATLDLAQLYAGPLKDQEKAQALAKRARELSPADPEAAQLLGKLAYQSGNHAWAYSLLRETAIRQTNDAALFRDLGWAAYSVGQVTEANQAMQRSLAIEAQGPQADLAKWFLYLTAASDDSNRLAQAESRISELLKANPGHAPALMASAQLHALRGESSQAAEILEKLLVRFPKLAPAQKLLAALYARQPGKTEKAYELASAARSVLRDDASLAKTLGKLAYGRKDYRYASTLLEEGLRNSPQDAESLFLLGMSHYQLKAVAASKAALQKALAGGLGEPSASEARRLVAELQTK